MSVKKNYVGVVLCVLALMCSAKTIAEPGFVSVTSSVTKEVAPDTANISIYIESRDKTPEQASNKNKTVANDVINAIKADLTAESDIIRTERLVVRPEYVWTNNKRVIKGYMATNSVTVILKDLQKVGKVMDSALKAGATQIDNFGMTLSSSNKYCVDALAEAVKDTQIKASTIAKTLGTSVAGVKSITTSCSTQNSGSGMMRYAMSNKAVDMAEEVSTPVESGKIKIYANVNANYNLK